MSEISLGTKRKAIYLSEKMVVDALNARLGLEEEESDLKVGLYFLAPFGDDETALHFYSVVSPTEFFRNWEFVKSDDRSSKKMMNGFEEVIFIGEG